MNRFRRSLAEKAFKLMDKDKSGVLDIDDIKGVYNAKFHPDVKAGKKTEEEVLGEFLDTFELHYAMNVSCWGRVMVCSMRGAEIGGLAWMSGLSITTT